jgi:hypothetical protein
MKSMTQYGWKVEIFWNFKGIIDKKKKKIISTIACELCSCECTSHNFSLSPHMLQIELLVFQFNDFICLAVCENDVLLKFQDELYILHNNHLKWLRNLLSWWKVMIFSKLLMQQTTFKKKSWSIIDVLITFL